MTDVSCLTFIFSGNQLGPPWSHTISPSVNAQLLYLPMLRTNDELCSLCQVVHWFLIPVSVLCRRFLFDDWIMTDREPRDRNMLRLPTVDLRSRWHLRGSGNGCNFILNEGGWLTFFCSNSPFIKAVPSRRLWIEDLKFCHDSTEKFSSEKFHLPNFPLFRGQACQNHSSELVVKI